MSDLISRKALLKKLKRSRMCHAQTSREINLLVRCENIANEQPSVDAVQVVHCKNCKHWGTGVAGETEHVKCCEYGKYMVGENGYCVYGEKV